MFLYLRIKLLAGDIRPEEAAANAPLTPPSGIEAGRPTIDRAVARLAVESKVENIPQPAALHLTAFLARLYFFATDR